MVRIAAQAQIDIVDTLRFTKVRLGESVRSLYQDLLQATFQSLADDPAHISSTFRDELSPGLRSLHLGSNSLEVSDGRIITPRHIIFYRTGKDEVVEILRVLHDAMEVAQHLNHLHQQ
ncbi:type II toxin-antitoxin system RelE/ParE family toxin [Pseudomonas asiatica]|uniref:Type II toxin-antitoxin system RelE/ParE family toxin n=1 Tax=Pseudomonas asiatica TaxID=2219225 RepID=A0ABU5KVS5_9PSED|nr:type II toxin-antitoxin system RelE/ParE family toxin [Pseudomonas asiatica]MDZ5738032.1 type II toxin-antitoxin system RelE/ParE family toxin [Pseudomonas asiatica]MDZ5744628.1 type II toxin-antitoxin system RelE/ParE family toxin [Pseudomonas asiatica]MDZ5748788.1 type II toxin-antitoxin system RelE/ParE family toxin [Pseudomonas asiatica]MDZ5753120.1 type II toxin-antitoxin system RelE/ParE family toxin [Pseudomonas asiatica]